MVKIAGLQKMTLLDYPGRVACTVFLGGCNFRCPFCHNGELLEGPIPTLMEGEELLAFLEKRRGLLDGVCITGGEPTLQPGLGELLAGIRKLGFAIKLDTNGSRPAVLKELAARGLVDYVAMDVKNGPGRYGETVGLSDPGLGAVEESLSFLLQGELDYELRTTVAAELHDEASLREMGEWILALASGRRAKRFFLQPFTDRDTVLRPGLHPPAPEELERYREMAEEFAQETGVRGL